MREHREIFESYRPYYGQWAPGLTEEPEGLSTTTQTNLVRLWTDHPF